MDFTKRFSGFCPTEGKEYFNDVEYKELRTMGAPVRYIKGFSICKRQSYRQDCPIAADCPLMAKAPEQIAE